MCSQNALTRKGARSSKQRLDLKLIRLNTSVCILSRVANNRDHYQEQNRTNISSLRVSPLGRSLLVGYQLPQFLESIVKMILSRIRTCSYLLQKNVSPLCRLLKGFAGLSSSQGGMAQGFLVVFFYGRRTFFLAKASNRGFVFCAPVAALAH